MVAHFSGHQKTLLPYGAGDNEQGGGPSQREGIEESRSGYAACRDESKDIKFMGEVHVGCCGFPIMHI